MGFEFAHYIKWEEENGQSPLYLVQDDDGHIDYEMSQPSRWHISLLNSGEKTINKLTIKISFSNIFFMRSTI